MITSIKKENSADSLIIEILICWDKTERSRIKKGKGSRVICKSINFHLVLWNTDVRKSVYLFVLVNIFSLSTLPKRWTRTVIQEVWLCLTFTCLLFKLCIFYASINVWIHFFNCTEKKWSLHSLAKFFRWLNLFLSFCFKMSFA